MNNIRQQLLQTDIDDFLAEVRHHNLYTIRFFFDGDVDWFYKNTKAYVAVKKSKKHINPMKWHSILRGLESTDVYCGLDRQSIQNLFNHPRRGVTFKYSEELANLVADGQLVVERKGVFNTKTMDKPLHYTKRYFIPEFELKQYIANHGGNVKAALTQSRAELSPRILNRWEKFLAKRSTEETQSQSVTPTLDDVQNTIEGIRNMTLTKEQSDAIDALCSRFTADLKEIVGGTDEPTEKTSVFMKETPPRKRRAKRQVKKEEVVPVKQTSTFMDDIPEISEEDVGRSKWIGYLEKKIPEWREEKASPSFLNSIIDTFHLNIPKYDVARFVGEIGTCDYRVSTRISHEILDSWNNRGFTLDDVDLEKWKSLHKSLTEKYA